MSIPSLCMIVDASPKAKMDASRPKTGAASLYSLCFSEVWCPLIVVNETLISWVLQRMSDIHFSTAENILKMDAARTVMDDMSTRFLEKDGKNKSVAKMKLESTYHGDRAWMCIAVKV